MHKYLQAWLFLCPTMLVVVRAATHAATEDNVPGRTTVPVYPAAARVFPSAQFTSSCGIITVQGLGLDLDGDYTLVDELAPDHEGKPAWIGTSPGRQYHLLSWQPVARAWAIGIHGSSGVYRAFVQTDSDLPPTYSSRWQLLAKNPDISEEVRHVVSITCPVCTAVTMSSLPDSLVPCNGPYRHRVAITQNSETTGHGGMSTWSHVSDERCALLHDNAGNSVVTLTPKHPPTNPGSASEAREKQFYSDPSSPEWWENIMNSTANSQLSLLGGDDVPRVVCTAAGRTTRLVLELVTTTMVSPAPRNISVDNEAVSTTSRRSDTKFVLAAPQDGSILSGTQGSNIHLRIHEAEEILVGTPATATAEVDDGMSLRNSQQLPQNVDNIPTSLHVKIRADGNEMATMSLRALTVEGVLLTLPGLEGTFSVGICLLDLSPATKGASAEGARCLSEIMVLFEIFSAETHIVRRRSSREAAVQVRSPSVLKMMDNGNMNGVIEEGSNKIKPGAGAIVDTTHVVFVVDLQDVDGYKLSTLHLIKHLPENFRASALDLSCATGDLPVEDIFDEEGVELIRICLRIPREAYKAAEAQHGNIHAFLYSTLANTTNWERQFVSAYPDVAGALADLHAHLTKFDTFVLPNGGKNNDAYLLEIARLAGVKVRMVNLGAVTGGYMSPLFPSGATSFVGPSQYVAHNPAVIRNAGGIPIKICPPVMDSARILEAAHSCPSGTDKQGKVVHPSPRMGARVTAIENIVFYGKDFEYPDYVVASPPVTFVMVGQLRNYKSPGLFVRAMGVLQRRLTGLRTASRRGSRGEQRQQRLDVAHTAEGILIGKGPLLGPMKTLAQKVNASVTFAGLLPVDIVPCWVQQATALVIPSTSSETFGMVGPEAMILGVPVVTFGFGGTGELVRHMENGIVVAEDPTPRALADALELLANDKALRDRLGAQARIDGLRATSLPELVSCHADEF